MSAHVYWGSFVAANGCPESAVTANVLYRGSTVTAHVYQGICMTGNQWWLRIYVGDQQ